MPSNLRVAAIGELLWDLLPDGPRLGGAPANFAVMSANLAASASSGSDTVLFISCVGNDALGRQAREQMAAHQVEIGYISIDSEHPTGTVTVRLDAQRGPAYSIHEGAAWDHVPMSPHLVELAPTFDAVCFGTLAQRSAVSRHAIRSFVEATRGNCVRVFDVNLRGPYWTRDTLAWGCGQATILKMNLQEVPSIAEALAARLHGQAALQLANFLLDQFPVELIAITRGAHGSLLVTREGAHEHRGVPVDVADTVGAGDAFTAALTYSVLCGRSLPEVAEAANRAGAWVATQRGGMPSIENRFAEHVFSNNF